MAAQNYRNKSTARRPNRPLIEFLRKEAEKRWNAQQRAGEPIGEDNWLMELMVDLAVTPQEVEAKTNELAQPKSEHGHITPFFNAPIELWKDMAWLSAFYAFDRGDRKPLAALIGSGKVIPAEFRSAVADVVVGKRAPKTRAAARVKVPPEKAFGIALQIEGIVRICQMFSQLPPIKGDSDCRNRLEELADELGTSPTEVRRDLEDVARMVVEESARQLGVSTETVENLLREFRRRVKLWPTSV